MRRRAIPAILLIFLALGLVLMPSRAADVIHRDGFKKGSTPAWIRADANVPFTEKLHDISDEHPRNDGAAERIRIEATPTPGSTVAEFVHYYYEVPAAPVTADLSATLYVKSMRAGTQLKARVVLPKEKDPNNPGSPLTVLINGDVYKDAQKWKSLSLGDAVGSLKGQLPAITAKLGRAVDTTEAYVDYLVLNVYSGAGVSELWIDDLSIGPVMPNAIRKRDQKSKELTKPKNPSISFSDGDILIDMHDEKGERPFFMRAIRHGNLPLGVLEQARFNTIQFPGTVTDEVYDQAIKAKFFLMPSLPLPPEDWDPARPNQLDPKVFDADTDVVSKHFKKFLNSDAVVMWHLGSGRTTEQVRRVAKLSETVRRLDPRRPRAVDLWDGFGAYSNYVDAVGGHRWPLFTSLELPAYRDWLAQRKALTGNGKLSITNIQTHLPEWYQTLNFGQPDCEKFPTPIGPHPEQIRLLTYMAIATGYRGLTYWSDQFLAEACHGQDRLLEIAILNTEIELLEPILMAAPDPATWIATDNAGVSAAVLRGPKETVVLPIWVGGGTQHCPDQMTVPSLSITVPLIPDGATAWRITAAGVEEIKDVKRFSEGTKITLSEFDTTAAIVFATDVSSKSKLVRWQENTRHVFARTAAYWARQQAWVQYCKTRETHKLIVAAGGPEVPSALKLFCDSKILLEEASKYTENNQPELAYAAARRAQRPLRIIMREHWRLATETLDVPTASPYAASFYSLPKHWELARFIQSSRPVGNALDHGAFELSEAAPDNGAAVASLPGWVARRQVLDALTPICAIVNTDRPGIKDLPLARTPEPDGRFETPGRPVPTPADRKECWPKPDLGKHCLQLGFLRKADGLGGYLEAPQALERSFVAVDSPVVQLAPGSWVCVSFWAKVPGGVTASADGLLVYDSAGGEPLGVRLNYVPDWKRYRLYRQVPASGKLQLTAALTGVGVAYLDDFRIEPLVQAGGSVPARPISELYKKPGIAPKPLPASEDTRVLPLPRENGKPGSEPLPAPKQLPTPRPAIKFPLELESGKK